MCWLWCVVPVVSTRIYDTNITSPRKEIKTKKKKHNNTAITAEAADKYNFFHFFSSSLLRFSVFHFFYSSFVNEDMQRTWLHWCLQCVASMQQHRWNRSFFSMWVRLYKSHLYVGTWYRLHKRFQILFWFLTTNSSAECAYRISFHATKLYFLLTSLTTEPAYIHIIHTYTHPHTYT